MVCCTSPCVSAITGSRDDFWLHALVRAFSVSGYWSGVTMDFSIRQPITRASMSFSFVCKAGSPHGVMKDTEF